MTFIPAFFVFVVSHHVQVRACESRQGFSPVLVEYLSLWFCSWLLVVMMHAGMFFCATTFFLLLSPSFDTVAVASYCVLRGCWCTSRCWSCAPLLMLVLILLLKNNGMELYTAEFKLRLSCPSCCFCLRFGCALLLLQGSGFRVQRLFYAVPACWPSPSSRFGLITCF